MATPGALAEALAFSKPLHGVLLQWLRTMGSRAALGNEEKHEAMQKVEMANRLYVDPTAVDDKGNLKNPYDTLIHSSWTRSARDAAVASVWLPWAQRDPFMPLSGREPGDIVRAQLMAARLQYDVDKSQLPLKMYPWLGQAVDFGFACMSNYWVRDRRVRVRYDRDGRRRELVEEYEGNFPQLEDPYRLLPDPDVPVGRHQEGSMFGYSRDLSHAMLMRKARAKNDRGDTWCNVEQLKSGKWTAQDPFLFGSQNASIRNRVQNLSDPGDSSVFGTGSYVDGGSNTGRVLNYHIETCIEVVLSPRDLINIAEQGSVTGFGETLARVQPPAPEGEPDRKIDADDLQYWKFVMIDGRVITDMEPLPTTEFNAHILECDPDLLSRYTPGRTELAIPMSDQINRIINRHNANQDRGVYGVHLINPNAIDPKAWKNAITGGYIPTLDEWQGPLSDALLPVPWQDVTRQDLQDIPMWQDLVMRLMRTSDQGMGQVSQGRRAAYDVAAATSGANQGAQTMGKLMAWQGINKLLKSMIQNVQLYDTQERWVRITGSLEQTLAGSQGVMPPPLDSVKVEQTSEGMRAWIGPDDVQGEFDIAVLDGRPTGPDAQRAQAYIQLMQVLTQAGGFTPGPADPKTGQTTPPRFDIMWPVKRFAEEMGIRNLRDAELQPKMLSQGMVPPEVQQASDEAMMQQVGAGNLAPVNEGAGGYG